jgi:cob(I)alamin adenosyltransferase
VFKKHENPQMAFENGYIQVYTGDGKGKTTAALGLALRAAGAGLNVYVAQFIKSGDYSEIKALSRLADRITVEQFGWDGSSRESQHRRMRRPPKRG